MVKKKCRQVNFLDMVPSKSEKIRWVVLENEIIQIQIDRNSWLNRAVRLFFKTPEMIKIDLDQYGSFIWNMMDGTRNVGHIADEFKACFGEEVEPLYQRLGTYINILKNNDFIRI